MTTWRRRGYVALAGTSSLLLFSVGTLGSLLAEYFLVASDDSLLGDPSTRWWLAPLYLLITLGFALAYGVTIFGATKSHRKKDRASLCRWSILCLSVGALEAALAVLLVLAALVWDGGGFF